MGRWTERRSARATPQVRPVLVVLFRALVAGAALGPVLALVLLTIASTVDLASQLAAGQALAVAVLHVVPLSTNWLGGLEVLVVLALLGTGVALVTAAVWLGAVHLRLGRLSDPAAGAVAVLLTSPVWWFGGWTGGGVLGAALVGTSTAALARWQGYARSGRPGTGVRPTSSPRAG